MLGKIFSAFTPTKELIVLHDDPNGASGIMVTNPKLSFIPRNIGAVLFALAVIVGLGLWVKQIVTQDVSQLPFVINLPEEHKLSQELERQEREREAEQVALAIEAARKAELKAAQALAEAEEADEALSTAVAPQPAAQEEPVAAQTGLMEDTEFVVETVSATPADALPSRITPKPRPLPKLKPNLLDEAIVSAIAVIHETEFEVENASFTNSDEDNGMKTSRRPQLRPAR